MATVKKRTKKKASAASAKPAKSMVDALEKAIEKAPDAADAYLVYADYLTEQGDPLGELITVQAQIASASASASSAGKKKTTAAAAAAAVGPAKLQRREKELLEKHGNEWMGSIAQLSKGVERRNPFTGQMQHFPAQPDPTMRFGFIESIRILFPDDLPELFSVRLGRFLRELELTPDFLVAISKLVEIGVPRTLRRLAFVLQPEHQISWIQLGNLAPLYPRLKNLRELSITAGGMELGKIDLPALTSFEVVTGGLSRDSARAIAGANWPKLEKLILYFGDPEYGGDARPEDLRPIFDGKGLGRVSHLALCNSMRADDLAKAIVKAKLLPQLATLDLSKGTLSDTGAEALIKASSKLKHLKRLDLTQNYISEDAQEELTAAFGSRVDYDNQADDTDESCYVQIGE
jgi:uncharacterized protein (TIGR02996 family)